MWFIHALKAQFGMSSHDSAMVAKNRLKVVLTHDRVNLSPEDILSLKQELIAVFSKYVELEQDSIDVALTRTGSVTSLVANIPLRSRQKKGTLKRFEKKKR